MTRGIVGTSPKTNCAHCTMEFPIRPYKLKAADRHYCGRYCKYESQRRTSTEPCENCGKSVTRRRSGFRRGTAIHVFCDKSCATRWRSKNPSATRMYGFRIHDREKFFALYDSKCFLCGFDRFVEFCHIIPSKDGGTIHPHNIVTLCPNHHTLFDRNLLTIEEAKKLIPVQQAARKSPYSTRFRRRRQTP